MDLKKYIYGHCVHPVKTWVYDTYSMQRVLRELPCGKCLHCRNTYINDWVSRLFAQYYDSKYCYFVSLDYAPFDSSSAAELLAKETAACMHDINKNHHLAMHPLVLCKNHLQDFFKRLRKNTGIKFQYFACGEYGTHANGRGYGRPHFHMIVFSNDVITHDDFKSAWTLNGYLIGRVDYDDMKNVMYNDTNLLKSFKYVCKYLIKQNFDFEKLATINFHRAYFKSLQYVFENTDTLFPKQVAITDASVLKYNWQQYIKQYSPFIVCSKRPSIGYSYYARNAKRFEEQDYRLFGLPDTCTTFPRYFLRKTKESLCDVVSYSPVSEKCNTSSTISYVASLLRHIQDERLDFARFASSVEDTWYIVQNKFIKRSPIDEGILLSSFHVYDKKNKIFFQFNGYYYTLWQKQDKLGFVRLRIMDIYEACDLFESQFSKYYAKYVVPSHFRRVLSESNFKEMIEREFPCKSFKESMSAFYDVVSKYYEQELASMYTKKLLMQNSKTTL